MIQEFFAGNRRFQQEEYQANADYYGELARQQKPTAVWIGCADSRVSEVVITGSKPGTLFVHRNIANIVAVNDVNVSAVLEYALGHLKIEDVIVCGHTRCGGVAALEDGIDDLCIADWLLNSAAAKERVNEVARERNLSREEKLALLGEENVRLQLEHLDRHPVVRAIRRRGQAVHLHGWIYAVETGLLRGLVDGRQGQA